MGTTFKKVISGLALGGLAACGGGGGLPGGGGVVGGSVTPVFATDTGGSLIGLNEEIDKALIDPARGATGYVVVYDQFSPNPQIREVKIRLSPDRETIYITVPGVTNEAVAAMDTPSNLGGTYGENPPTGGVPLISTLHSFNTGQLSYKKTTISGFNIDDTTMQGVYGIETPHDRVPASATYTGDLGGFGIPTIGNPTIAGINGDITLVLLNGDVSGSFDGEAVINSTSAGATGSFDGGISDNVLSGSFDFTSAIATGNATFVGKVYGWDADDIAGVFEGTISPTGSGTLQLYGTFEAD